MLNLVAFLQQGVVQCVVRVHHVLHLAAFHEDELLVGRDVELRVLQHDGNPSPPVGGHHVGHVGHVHLPGEHEIAVHHVGGRQRVAALAVNQIHFTVGQTGCLRRDSESLLRQGQRRGQHDSQYDINQFFHTMISFSLVYTLQLIVCSYYARKSYSLASAPRGDGGV